MDQLPRWSGLSGGDLSGNPLAMAAGLAQLHELERINGWKLLDELGAQFEKLALDALKHAKIDVTFHRLGSLFCLFFASGPIIDLASAQRSNLKIFARFFHACLKRGVPSPSQFEMGPFPQRTLRKTSSDRHGVRERWSARAATGFPKPVPVPCHVERGETSLAIVSLAEYGK
jgi:glutamate-1-semialdehyde aminotransferase